MHESSTFHGGNRELQDRFDTRRIADRIDQLLVHDRFTPEDAEFIGARDMFFLASADASGQPSCSYKGGDPGFVRVIDESTLAWPNYDGNGMYLSMGNALRNPRVGLLFVDFTDPSRLRVEGTARIEMDDPLMAEWPEAQFVVRVTPTRIYPNCPRYVHRYQLAERSGFVPRAGCKTPIPEWKESEWANDALPSADPARRA